MNLSHVEPIDCPLPNLRIFLACVIFGIDLIFHSFFRWWDFGVFNQIYVMLNQRPSSDYYVIAIYSYRESFGVTQYGLGAAIAVVMVLVLVIVTFFYVRETVKVAEIA